MNLSPLKALLPGRGMLFVLVGIGLAIGWYLYRAEGISDHLVKRNFNYLNQVTSNINASVEAARDAVRFNSRNVQGCLRERLSARVAADKAEAVLTRETKSCLGNLRARLVAHGSLAGSNSDIEIDLGSLNKYEAAGGASLAPLCPTNAPLLCTGEGLRNAVSASTFINQPVSIVAGGVKNPFVMRLQYRQGGRTYDYAAHFTLTVPFGRIPGVDTTESFFDALLLARSDGARSQVLFSNTEVPLQLDEHNIAALFKARSGFERFNSAREFELQNGRLHGPIGGTGDPEGEGEPLAFTQSSLVPTVIGGFSHLAFVQPFRSAHTGDSNLVLIGIVGESSFNKLKYAVPFNWLSNALLLLIVGVLSLNFFRLKLIRDRGVVRRWDTVLGVISMTGIASLFVVFLVHILGSYQLNKLYKDDLAELQRWMAAEFHQELQEKFKIIERAGRHLAGGRKPSVYSDGEFPDCKTSGDDSNTKYECKADRIPEVSTLFILNETGHQDRAYLTHLNESPPTGFNVSTRGYFREIEGGHGWRWYKTQRDDPHAFEDRFYLERIESKAEGALETAMSMPVRWIGEARAEQGVVVGLFKLQSLEQTALPPGFGFAVFDRRNGQVLFHSNTQRSLRENFYRATDDNDSLKAAIVAGVGAELNLNYKGENVRASVVPLANTQWNLAVFYRNSIIDIVNFHFGMSALMLAASYMLIWLVGLPLALLLVYWLCRLAFVERLHRSDNVMMPPQWLYPVAAQLPRQKQLAKVLMALVLAYIPVIYFADLPSAKYWVMLFLAAVPLSWYWLLRSPTTARRAVGSGGNEVFPRELQLVEKKFRREQLVSTYRWFRLNACLAVLVLAVMPTMLLHNENYDVHEKLWVEFSNWSNADRLRARSHDYRKYMERFIPGARPVESLIGEQWRGVYLPHTEIYQVPDPVAACEAGMLARSAATWWLERHPARRSDRPRTAYEEGTQYIEVLNTLSPRKPQCMFVPDALGNLVLYRPALSGHREQSSYMSRIVGLLPSIDDEGSLLESFIELDKKAAGIPANDVESGEGLQGRRLQSVRPDADTNIAYAMYNFFPHTRPLASLGIMAFYAVLAALSGFLISILHGFLMRKFLSREFEENLPDVARGFELDDLARGGAVIAPAGIGVRAAFPLFVESMGLKPEDYADDPDEVELWGVKDVALVPARKLLILKAFINIIRDRAASARVMELIRRLRSEGYSTVILSDIDLEHWIYHRMYAEDMPQEEFHRWEGLINSLSTFMLPIWETLPDGSRQLDSKSWLLPRRNYRRTWQRCSEDEQMVLLGLHYEGVVNPRNEFTLRSLYRRRLVEFRNGHFEFGDPGWKAFVAGQMHRAGFHDVANRYKNNVWRAFRAPMLLILLVLVLFIAYVAQDQMKLVFSLIGTVGGGAAALSTLGNRLRELRGLTGQ